MRSRKQKKRLRNYGWQNGIPVLAIYNLQERSSRKRDVIQMEFLNYANECWDAFIWEFKFPTFMEFSMCGIATQKAINVTMRIRNELIEMSDFAQAVDKLPPWEREQVLAGHLQLNVPSGKVYQNNLI